MNLRCVTVKVHLFIRLHDPYMTPTHTLCLTKNSGLCYSNRIFDYKAPVSSKNAVVNIFFIFSPSLVLNIFIHKFFAGSLKKNPL